MLCFKVSSTNNLHMYVMILFFKKNVSNNLLLLINTTIHVFSYSFMSLIVVS